MIAKLKGSVESVDADSAVIDVNGVGYLVSASARTLRDFVVGGPTTVLVETIVREDAIALYGFLETAERDWFRLLTTVQGVGARLALAGGLGTLVLHLVEREQGCGRQIKR